MTQKGFALIEALAALLVVSFGLLGLAGALADLVSATTDAQLRSEASLLASELVGMASADPTNLACYTTDQAGCASASAKALKHEWDLDVPTRLPGASSKPPTVTLDATTAVFAVTLFWFRSSNDVTHNHVVLTRITS